MGSWSIAMSQSDHDLDMLDTTCSGVAEKMDFTTAEEIWIH